jgi:hypothetical protein
LMASRRTSTAARTVTTTVPHPANRSRDSSRGPAIPAHRRPRGSRADLRARSASRFPRHAS